MAELIAWPGSASLRAIVTGASDGIGADCARLLASHGAQVALADIDKVPLARLANEIGAHGFACDVLSEQSVSQLVANLAEALPGADLLINAAGKGYVRALGMMRVSRSFAAAASGARPATIVNIAAPGGPAQPFAHAGSAKAFQLLSDGLGRVLAERGITVLTIDKPDSAAMTGALIARLCRDARAPVLHREPRSARG